MAMNGALDTLQKHSKQVLTDSSIYGLENVSMQQGEYKFWRPVVSTSGQLEQIELSYPFRERNFWATVHAL